MLSRLVCLLVLFLTIPAFSQRTSTATRTDQWIWSRGKMMKGDTAPGLDTRAARLEAIHTDAAELAELSSSVQSSLQQLQRGLLAKDLEEKLKKMEKLAKKLRRDIAP